MVKQRSSPSTTIRMTPEEVAEHLATFQAKSTATSVLISDQKSIHKRSKIRSLLMPFIWLASIGSFHPWTGLRGKTLWDGFEKIVLPIVLLIVTIRLTGQQTTMMQLQNKITDEQLKSEVLRNYTSVIQDLILHEKLLQSKKGENVSVMATTQTALALKQLDQERKVNLLLFIYQLQLINKQAPIIDLNGVNLSGVNLSGADLSRADLSGADLSGADFSATDFNGTDLISADLSSTDASYANLSGADLSAVNLSSANLYRTDLSFADLSSANLSFVNLTGAIIVSKQLRQAASLQGVTLPNGSKYP